MEIEKAYGFLVNAIKEGRELLVEAVLEAQHQMDDVRNRYPRYVPTITIIMLFAGQIVALVLFFLRNN